MTCCEADLEVGDDEAEDPRCNASLALRRLVGFVASALDVRFAFVVAFDSPVDPRGTALWLARDYGLRSEYAQIEATASADELSSPDFGRWLQRAWPHEPELADVRLGRCVAVALKGSAGHVLGHMGIVDPERPCRLSVHERHTPLARRAALEAARWSGSRH